MGKQTTGQPFVTSTCWRWVGERGLRVETGDMTLARYALLISKNLPDIEDIIPADGSLLLILRRAARVSPAVWAALSAPLDVALTAVKGKRHEIVVDYGGAVGPDLPALAKRAGMSVAAYIDCHAAVEYVVTFLGFQPGFPYLQGLPPTLQAARRASPRQQVAAGSVAIGGRYAGIYPTGGPGGWHVIGRTDTVLFDPLRAAPALLLPGDRVRFVPA
jgi:5-oxoprolinase (ATP-hydrolysing) subunit B